MNKNFGLTDIQYSFVKASLNDFLKLKKNYKIFVFGSRAKGSERQYSDLDLWIDSEPELTDVEISTFAEKIELSDLPIKIDVVTDRTCLAEYRGRILSERVSLS